MEFYNRISIITNEIRLSELRNFRGLISGYFEDLTYGNFGGSPIEGETARELRPQINRKIARISSIVFYSGTSSSNQTLRPPIVGGGSYSVDILANLFYLGNHDIGRDADFDLLDRSIGIYEGDRLNAALRSLNPFWWIWKAVNWLSALPFKLIGQADSTAKLSNLQVQGAHLNC